ncbi:hypothetical protein EV714DRAFT_208735 [Schizophyllum commune]
MSLNNGREPNLWFHNGNVIVRAGDRFCRLYRELLATQSSVLADKPPDVETFNGLPVLTLPDDPDEVLVWLKSLLVPGYFELYPRLIGPQKVLAVLRLSHKYNVSYLRQHALHHLSTYFPTKLGDLRERYADWTSSIKFYTDPDEHMRWLCQAYKIACEVGATWLRPSIMYAIHSEAWPLKQDGPHQHMSAYEALDKSDLIHLYALSAGIPDTFGLALAAIWQAHSCSNCDPETDIALVQSMACRSLIDMPLQYMYLDGAFTSHLRNGLCTSCLTEFKRRYDKACSSLWNSLPGMMGLPQWSELRLQRAPDLGMT